MTTRLSSRQYEALDQQITAILDSHRATLDLADTQLVAVELKVEEQWGFWAWARNVDDAPEPQFVKLLGVYSDEGSELIMGKLQVLYGKPVETEWKDLLEEEQAYLIEAGVVPLEMRENDDLAERVITYHYLGTSEPVFELVVNAETVALMKQYLQGVRLGISITPTPYFEDEFSVPRLVSAVELWTYDLGSLLGYVLDDGGEQNENEAAHFLMAVQVALMSKDNDINRIATHLRSIMTAVKK